MINAPLHVAQATVQSTTTEHAERAECDAERSRYLATQTVCRDITETLGTTFVPDLFAALERTPAYLEAAWELFKDELGLDLLDACTKRIVALAITMNRSGTYQIAAFPHAFRLSPVGPKRCEIILSLIWDVSGIQPIPLRRCASSR